VASCAVVSFDTNLPVDELGAGVGLAAVVAAAALRDVTPYRAAPATPPTTIDPAMAAAVTAARILFMVADFLLTFYFARALALRLALDARRAM
jgi:hypothetical protein